MTREGNSLSIKVGDVLTKQSEFDAAPVGTLVKFVYHSNISPSGATRLRVENGWFHVNNGSTGDLADGCKYEVLYVPDQPEEPNEVDEIAVALWNARYGAHITSMSEVGELNERDYGRMAEWVLENYEKKRKLPSALIDRDGDRWELQDNAVYTVLRADGDLVDSDADLIRRTYADVRAYWGISEEIA